MRMFLGGVLSQNVKQQQEDPCQVKSKLAGDATYCDRYIFLLPHSEKIIIIIIGKLCTYDKFQVLGMYRRSTGTLRLS